MRYKWKLFAVITFSIALISTTITNVHAFGFTEDQKDVMNLQTFKVSDFGDNKDDADKIIWRIKPSRFAFPKKEDGKYIVDVTKTNWWDTNHLKADYVYGRPLGLDYEVEKTQKWTLGIKAQFIKRAYNWIEVYPFAVTEGSIYDAKYTVPETKEEIDRPINPAKTDVKGTNTTLELRGIVKSLDLWVWGGNYNWWLEFHLIDYLGFMHRLDAGSIKHVGWNNMRTKIPHYLPQYESYAPFLRSLRLVMVKLWSYPNEQVRHFYTYFDYMQVQTDVYIQRYNGDVFGKNTNW